MKTTEEHTEHGLAAQPGTPARAATLPLDLEFDRVLLPPPAFAPGATLEAALRQRRSLRSFSTEPLALQMLSNLLWAGGGINRQGNGQDSGHRTAPSARNWQEISLLAVLPEGAYRYEPAGHQLLLIDAQDLRSLTGLQDFVASAPLNLVYVADFERMHDCRADERPFFAGADAAFAAQNVLLACASAGLATVVRALIDRRQLAAALRLRSAERVALAQSIGWPGPGA